MKIKIYVGIILSLIVNMSFAGDYILTIDGESYEVSLNEETKVEVGGRSVLAKFTQKDYLTYTTDSFSFEYPNQYSPSKSDLGEGIFQNVMMTPLGVVVLVQEYTRMDPTALLDLMINEMTKEEREYGYKINATPSSTTLSDGSVLSGKVVTSKYKGSDIKRTFYTYGIKDAGLFIVTQIDYEVGSSDKGVIDTFMSSLSITMN
ncbi:hypothetical protein KO489_14795 [Reinekea forsetii]|nr:hypothetical protein [Reinekea forsetii]